MIEKLYKQYLHSQKRIRVQNFLGRIWNSIYNNNFSNWLKEALSIGMKGYRTYLVCDENGMYVSEIIDGRLENGRRYSDLRVTDSVKFALDIQPYGKIKRWLTLNKVNKIVKFEGLSFRYKRILELEANVGINKPAVA